MSADKLRRAADLLRQRAEAAPAWWLHATTGHDEEHTYLDADLDLTLTIRGDAEHPVTAAAAYIAAMAPPVGLLLAGLLEAEAKHLELLALKGAAVNFLIATSAEGEDRSWRVRLDYSTTSEALALADLILAGA